MAHRRGPLARRAAVAVALAAAGLLAAGPLVVPAVADDANQAGQWALARIGAPAAWASSTGAGVPIAVIDTGVDRTHPDLAANVAAVTTCVGTGGDPAGCQGDGADIVGHGTHVSGIAAAARNGVGVAGVAPDARLYVAGVFSQQGTSNGQPQYAAQADDIVAGIRWAVRTAPRPGVINLSLGESSLLVQRLFGSGFETAVEEAWSAGWVVVGAIGNNDSGSTLGGLVGQDYSAVHLLAVGATGPNDEPAWYTRSLAQTKWGLVAPGGDATAGCDQDPGPCVLSDWPGTQLAYLQGTSMATPAVSGAAALLLGLGLTNAQAVQRLLDTADRGVSCGAGCSGRLDAAKAVAGLGPAPGSATAGSASAPAPAPSVAPVATAGPAGSATARRPSAAAAPGSASATTSTQPPPTTEGASPAEAAAPDPASAAGLAGGLAIASPPGSSFRRGARDHDDDVPVPLAVVAGGLLLGVAGVTARFAQSRRRTVTTLP